MTTDELRAKFEAFFSDCNLRRLNMRSDCYEDARIALLWEGWQAAYDSRDAEVEALKREVDDLAALVRRLAHSLDKPSGNTLLARQAMDYLHRHNLQGSPMRNND